MGTDGEAIASETAVAAGIVAAAAPWPIAVIMPAVVPCAPAAVARIVATEQLPVAESRIGTQHGLPLRIEAAVAVVAVVVPTAAAVIPAVVVIPAVADTINR
jgi:hypothetical protein